MLIGTDITNTCLFAAATLITFVIINIIEVPIYKLTGSDKKTIKYMYQQQHYIQNTIVYSNDYSCKYSVMEILTLLMGSSPAPAFMSKPAISVWPL